MTFNKQIVAVEHRRGTSRRTYISSSSGDFTKPNISVVQRKTQSIQSLWFVFCSVFMPIGYPESVSSDYLKYQFWDSIQAFASGITGTIALRGILTGVGVGDANASTAAAVTTWILRDGLGMLGQIIFAWRRGSALDTNPKQWRLVADILNDFAIALELLCLNFLREYASIALCFSSMMKAIVGVAGGATRAALVQHQARKHNAADVSAKDNSQETVVRLTAMLTSLALMRTLPEGPSVPLYVTFALFTALHLYANYMAVSSVVMDTLNERRFRILLTVYLRTNRIPSLESVNGVESMWLNPFKRSELSIRFGCSFEHLLHEKCFLSHKLRNAKFLLSYNQTTKSINVVLHESHEIKDLMEATFQAYVLEKALGGSFLDLDPSDKCYFAELATYKADDHTETVELWVAQFVSKTFQDFFEKLKLVWRTDVFHVPKDDWRVCWNPDEMSSADIGIHSKSD